MNVACLVAPVALIVIPASVQDEPDAKELKGEFPELSGGQYVAGGRVTVTEDPRLSVTVMLHELMVPHGSATAAVSAR